MLEEGAHASPSRRLAAFKSLAMLFKVTACVCVRACEFACECACVRACVLAPHPQPLLPQATDGRVALGIHDLIRQALEQSCKAVVSKEKKGGIFGLGKAKAPIDVNGPTAWAALSAARSLGLKHTVCDV